MLQSSSRIPPPRSPRKSSSSHALRPGTRAGQWLAALTAAAALQAGALATQMAAESEIVRAQTARHFFSSRLCSYRCEVVP